MSLRKYKFVLFLSSCFFQRSEKHKIEGNAAFNSNDFQHAVGCYGRAIQEE